MIRAWRALLIINTMTYNTVIEDKEPRYKIWISTGYENASRRNWHRKFSRKLHTLCLFYDTNVSGEDFITENKDCKMLLRTQIENLPRTVVDLLEFLVGNGDDVFPILRISLQILLTVAVLIAICERFFSKQRLSNLALPCKEREKFENINFGDVIDQFARWSQGKCICEIS